MSRGFFSIFVGAFAVVLLISFFYSQSVHYQTDSHAAELSVIQQSLSKDWFMTRNALANFASDAILEHIALQNPAPSLGNCNQSFASLDYATQVESYWDEAVKHINDNFGTNCDVNLSVEVQNLVEGITLPAPSVLDEERSYGLLSCSRSTATGALTIKRPFVIRKDVRISSNGLACVVSVFDILGDNPSGYRYEKIDVNQAFT